ncbi:hypothetical protein ASPWEDRAFT_48977 [Aspergillus wentii DTO 134E9]|uniref:Mitochondrial thiamine pyrophosphate carrier 1 n=1 Tax=Aspergillus wentii DTO 134E9 TaxID=1073089 RepID=A0A1L9RV77_ASPWE|nr:uncharacterized protein ASPWEDRAFT_48977 [Aspergillus wentii DTO 134E9]OJJ38851.1 hypothetical protein ASPWEDRAFT_48977 [Aspergillus wentii DTO 134E9]
MYNSNFDIWIAGAFSAVVVDFFVYPFDTLKTRIQSPDYAKLYKDARTGAVKRNVLFRGLYQGVWSVVISTIPSSGAFFTTYEAAKYTLNNASATVQAEPHNSEPNRLPFTHSLPNPIIHGISSSCAEIVACLMLTPAEVLKQNAQVVDLQPGHRNDNATMQVISRFRHRHWKLWSGYTALVGRNLPFTGLHFPLFEYVRSHVVDWRELRKEQQQSHGDCEAANWNPVLERAALTGFAAGVSGMTAAVVTTPIDVIKTRVMLSASTEDNNGGDAKKPRMADRTMLSIGKEIYRKEGVRGLFLGGALRAAWTAVSLSMYLSIYEGARFYLENRRREKNRLETHSEVEKEDEAAM